MGSLYEDIRPHSLKKHEMLQRYLAMFTTSMKSKFKHRVYIDLFAGCGEAQIDCDGETHDTSPLIALSVQHPFTRYIFCEQNEEKASALLERVAERHPGADVRIVKGDVNLKVNEILAHMPSKSEGVLTFAMVDPYNLGTLKFRTLESLARAYWIDMLVLLATYMDGKRNQSIYVQPENDIIAELLGDPNWRAGYSASSRRADFGKFLIAAFMERMNTIGYLENHLNEVETIKIAGKGVRLYNLTFFTRNALGKKFWKAARIQKGETIPFDFSEE